MLNNRNYRPPENAEEDEEQVEDDEESMDILDKNIESFKLFGIFLAILLLSLLINIVLASMKYQDIEAYLPNDPLFLTFRLSLVSLSIAAIYFVIRWSTLVTDQN